MARAGTQARGSRFERLEKSRRNALSGSAAVRVRFGSISIACSFVLIVAYYAVVFAFLANVLLQTIGLLSVELVTAPCGSPSI